MNLFTPAALTLSSDLADYCHKAKNDVAIADIRRLALVIVNTRGAGKAFADLVKSLKVERSRLTGTVEIPS